jgi:predicted TIM-barrel fold metal-dependent hydrolase
MGSIDVHTHFVPQTFLDELLGVGITPPQIGYPPKGWDASQRLALMERHDIDAEMLSLSAPGLRFWRGDKARTLARELNEDLAEIVRDNPQRFGGFATLPLPDVDAALDEIEHALDQLHLDGVVLMTNYDGEYVGNPRFAPVLDELNRRKAVMFVHPTEGPANDSLTQGYPAPAFEFPAETTRMVVSLIDGDVVARCPDLKIIASHGGGTIPLLQDRLALILPWKRNEDQEEGAKRVNAAINSLYFDTAIVSFPAPLAAIKLTHDTSRLLTGYDLPFFPEKGLDLVRKNFASFAGFTDEDKAMIHSGNAQKLFPRLQR